jgi:hypothetical protein
LCDPQCDLCYTLEMSEIQLQNVQAKVLEFVFVHVWLKYFGNGYNKSLIKPNELTVFDLYEGCALAIKIKWSNMEETVLLNIYTPNNKVEHSTFWTLIETRQRLQCL